MAKLFIFCFVLLLIGCKQVSPINDSLPLLDVSKEYPIQELDIHDIADVEYVALETNQESLLSRDCSFFSLSDQYIVAHSMKMGEVLFFDRSGKHLWTFCRRGAGGEEYHYIILLAVDFTAEECFISDGTDNLHVYSIKGEYKRTLHLDVGAYTKFTNLFDYNKDFLIGYNGFFGFDAKEGDNKNCYWLIDKKNGSLHSIDLITKRHISPRIYEEDITFSGGGYLAGFTLPTIPIVKNGSEILIANYASDTLYHFVDNVLSPIAIRIPSVFSSDPPVIISPILFTDSYLGFKVVSTKYDPAYPMKYYEEAPDLIWNRHTNEIQQWRMYDSNFSSKQNVNIPLTRVLSSNISNYGMIWYPAQNLLDRYSMGELKGSLKEIASRLKEDDNMVLVICRYK